MLSALTYLMTPRRPAVVDSTRDRSASDLKSEDEPTNVEELSVDLKRDESEENRIRPPQVSQMIKNEPKHQFVGNLLVGTE